MVKTEEIMELGKSILNQQHLYVSNSDLDDLNHISEMKVVIKGIQKYLDSKNFSEIDVNIVINTLEDTALKNFLDHCSATAKSMDTPVDEELDREYYQYIYEHGDYPE